MRPLSLIGILALILLRLYKDRCLGSSIQEVRSLTPHALSRRDSDALCP